MATYKFSRQVLTGICAAGVSMAAFAQSSTPSFSQLQEQIEQQRRALDAQQKALENTQRQLQVLQSQAAQKAQTTQNANSRIANNAAIEEGNNRQANNQDHPIQVGAAPENEQAEKASQVAAVMEQPGVLTPRHHFVLEPSLEYNYSSTNRVSTIGYTVIPAIIVGLIDMRRVNSTTVTAALTGRYGISNRWEIEAKVPYVYRSDKTVSRPYGTGSSNDEVFNSRGHHLGDVELGLRYQFNHGGAGKPYYIGSLRATLPTGKGPFDIHYASGINSLTGQPMQTEQPTGSGFYGIQPGIQMIFPSDPAVFYAGFNYMHRFSRHVNKRIGESYIGRVNPGDAMEVNFGMGMALNDRASISLGYQHTYVKKTKLNGQVSASDTSTQLGRLLLGYSYRITPKTNLNMTLSAGVTHDSPDVGIIVRVPIDF